MIPKPSGTNKFQEYLKRFCDAIELAAALLKVIKAIMKRN